ncbi:hypothetical protein [Nonomuraea dietziae]|uniref:hypothetical protein n=1 Tax=Nonomuraea dietziae TaxID=65515 RepID=UPI0033F9C768
MDVVRYGSGSGGHVTLIGEWDPFSPAHAQLLCSTVSSAALAGRSVLVVTLDPAPASHIFGPMACPPFDDVAARLFLQERCGVQTRATVGLSAVEVERCGVEDLLAELCELVTIEELVLGARQTLGVGRLGYPAAVDEAARKRGIQVRRLDPVVTGVRTARALLAKGCVQKVADIVGRHLYWGRPEDGSVRLPWPPGWYRAVPYSAPSPAHRLPGEDVRIEIRESDGTGCFPWPAADPPWLGFAVGPHDIRDRCA